MKKERAVLGFVTPAKTITLRYNRHAQRASRTDTYLSKPITL